jgi:hypothetical protein
VLPVLFVNLFAIKIRLAGWLPPRHERLPCHVGRVAKVAGSAASRAQNLGEAEIVVSGAIEKIPIEITHVNGENRKMNKFERKYDMSILGNIYILAFWTCWRPMDNLIPGISLVYKAIY